MNIFLTIRKTLNEVWVVQRRAFVLLFRQLPWIVTALVVLAIGTALTPFLSAGSYAHLVDSVVARIAGDTNVSVLFAALFVVGAGILPDVIGMFRETAERFFWVRGSSVLELMYVKRRLELDIAHYEDPKLNDMMQKVEERSIYPFLNLFETELSNLTNLVGLVVAAVVLAFLDWRLLLILFIGVLPRLWIGIKYGKGVWTIYDANAEERRRFRKLRWLSENLTALMEIKIHGISGAINTRLRTLLDVFVSYQLILERKKFGWQIFALLSSLAAIATVFWLTISAAFGGKISPGAILFILAAVGQFEGALDRFFSGLGRMYEWHLFAREFFKLMDLEPKVDKKKGTRLFDNAAAPEITLEHVSFAYPGTEELVLRDVDLVIPSGSSCALVGVNGAGKSTLVKLLARFYDPTEGRILINGVDLKEFDIVSWHKAMGVLFQEFPLYKGLSAAEGIALGNTDIPLDLERVRRAAKQGGADEFIGAWPNGYNEIVGVEFTKGTDLSRGQQQRLALARIFYRGAKFLLLDEPTASIDAEAEEVIFREIEAIEGQTRLLISHRFSTVRNADQIIVLDNGIVKERGTHHELMEKNGSYARLFRLQAKGYADEAKAATV